MKHTKGPWKLVVDHEYKRICIDSYNGNDNCNPIAELELVETANANLIAAAPEMLEALEMALADMQRCEKHFSKTKDFGVSALALGLVEQAIAKAKGEK